MFAYGLDIRVLLYVHVCVSKGVNVVVFFFLHDSNGSSTTNFQWRLKMSKFSRSGWQDGARLSMTGTQAQ